MGHPFDHLTASTTELLHLPNEMRIREVLSERWVHYPRAKAALAALDRLTCYPRTTRMPSIAIYGDSGMGKTMIMKKFCRGSSARPRSAGKGIERRRYRRSSWLESRESVRCSPRF